MYITRIGTTPRRRAPIPGGPTMEVLVAAETPDNIAMLQVWIPPGGGLPEHDHGPSEIVLVHVSGSIELRQGDQHHRLAPAPSHASPPGNESAWPTRVPNPQS
ncbi:hypothetical protein OG555_37290 [Kribbella sp. NBC_01484]|uniref:cupin domain-containing protein n=1 Tax=Kribbella sp. NBC_01484 TaxID=2903579 RepID=UPI002E35ECDB|nr:hypothetical protein [Kribbella sp. NBC_01484]